MKGLHEPMADTAALLSRMAAQVGPVLGLQPLIAELRPIVNLIVADFELPKTTSLSAKQFPARVISLLITTVQELQSLSDQKLKIVFDLLSTLLLSVRVAFAYKGTRPFFQILNAIFNTPTAKIY
jgi:hypothetical protein